ncbi:MAG: hypothetical protein VYA30_08065 [Myxococcota bacterium]|nr:hypothetical protein [Myxococcota bacterium]
MPPRPEPNGANSGHTRLISTLPDLDEPRGRVPSQRPKSSAHGSRRRSQHRSAADQDEFIHSSVPATERESTANDVQRPEHLEMTQLLNLGGGSTPGDDGDLFDDLDATRVQTHDEWVDEQRKPKQLETHLSNESDDVWSTAETTNPLHSTSPGRDLHSHDDDMSDMKTKAVALSARPKTGGRLAAPPPFDHLYRKEKSETRDSGPDPTPRKRTPKRRAKETAKPQSIPSHRRSLDAAKPKPINRPREARNSQSRPSTPVAKHPHSTTGDQREGQVSGGHRGQITNNPFDKAKVQSGHDLIADVVESAQKMSPGPGLDESSRPAKPRKNLIFNYSIFGFLAISMGAGIALILTSEKVPTEQTQGRQQTSKLHASIVRLGIRPLPMVRADSIQNEQFIAMNKRAMDSSFGPIKGLTSTLALNKRIEKTGGQYVSKPLYDRLKMPGEKDTLLVALKPTDVVKNLALIGQSAIAAGYAEFSLVVERSNDGRLGAFPLTAGEGDIPAIGYLSVRIGQLGVYAEILGRNDEKLSGELAMIAPLADGRIDYDALDKRLDRLSRAAPLVRLAVLSLAGETSVADTMVLVSKLRFGPERERFTTVRIVPQ